MSRNVITLLLASVILSIAVSLCSAQDKDANRPKKGPEYGTEPKFRHKQINKIWEKAVRKNLHANKLEDLRLQLKKFDEKFLQLKKERQTDTKPDEIAHQERIIEQQLEETMRHYGIIPARDGMPGESFTDKRINNLWMTAMKNGHFSKDELEILRKDLLEHQRKVEDFSAAMKQHQKPESLENEVVSDGGAQDPMDRRAADIEMKLKHRELNKNFERLSVKVIPQHERAGFTNHKVIQLWQEAQQSNFEAEELEAIKEELLEFQEQIEHSDRLHEEVLRSEKDHFKEKNRSDRKDPSKAKEKKSLLASAREELQSASRKVTDFMRGFKEKLGKAGKKSEL